MFLKRLVVLAIALAALGAVPRSLAAPHDGRHHRRRARRGGGVLPGVTVTAPHEGAPSAVREGSATTQGVYVLRGLPVGRSVVAARTARIPDGEEHRRRRPRERRGTPRHRAEGRRRHRNGDRQRHRHDGGHGLEHTQDRRRSGAHRETAAERPQPHAVDDAGGRRDSRHRTDVTSGATYPGAAGVRPTARAPTRPTTSWTAGRTTTTTATPPTRCPIRTPCRSSRPDQQLQRRVRPQRRRDRQRRDPRGHQPVPRPRLRLLPRTTTMNADNFFTPGVDDGLKRSQFGGTFGGPIVQEPDVLLRVVPGHESAGAADQPIARAGADRGACAAATSPAIPRPLRNPLTGRAVPGQPDPADRSSARRRVTDPDEWLPLPNPDAGDRTTADAAVRAAGQTTTTTSSWPAWTTRSADNHRVYGRFWVSGHRRRRCLRRRQHPHQRVRPHLAEHRSRRSTTRVIVTPSLREQRGRDVQPDEQRQFPDLPPDYADARHQTSTTTTTPQWFFNVSRLVRHQHRRHQPFIRNEYPVRRHRCAGPRAGTRSPPASTTATARATSSTTSAPTAGTRSRTRRRSPATRWPTSCSASSRPSSRAIGEYKNTRMHYLARLRRGHVPRQPAA